MILSDGSPLHASASCIDVQHIESTDVPGILSMSAYQVEYPSTYTSSLYDLSALSPTLFNSLLSFRLQKFLRLVPAMAWSALGCFLCLCHCGFKSDTNRKRRAAQVPGLATNVSR